MGKIELLNKRSTAFEKINLLLFFARFDVFLPGSIFQGLVVWVVNIHFHKTITPFPRKMSLCYCDSIWRKILPFCICELNIPWNWWILRCIPWSANVLVDTFETFFKKKLSANFVTRSSKFSRSKSLVRTLLAIFP